MRSWRIATLGAVCCLWATMVTAQKSTEMFIPIGQSPGLAGKTSIGTIQSVNVETQELVITDGDVRRTIRCNEHTQVWLDRSAEKQPNETGSLASCRVAQRIEVRFVDDAKDGGLAEWIKVAEP